MSEYPWPAAHRHQRTARASLFLPLEKSIFAHDAARSAAPAPGAPATHPLRLLTAGASSPHVCVGLCCLVRAVLVGGFPKHWVLHRVCPFPPFPDLSLTLPDLFCMLSGLVCRNHPNPNPLGMEVSAQKNSDSDLSCGQP